MGTTINERIKSVLEIVYQGNVTAMAKGTYIKRTTLNSIVGEKEVAPGFEVIKNLGEISSPRLSMEWLIRGVGDMFLSDDKGSSINSHNENTNINDGDTIKRLISLLEEKDRQINTLLELLKK